jgi:hypothetical protein
MFKRNEPIEPKARFKFESYIGRNDNWWHYYGQYKNVIDEIVNGIEKNIPIDTVSLTLLFLIRHCLELALKSNILRLENVNKKVEPIKLSGTKYHSIEVLFNKFEQHLNIIRKEKKISQKIRDEIENYLTKLKPLEELIHKLVEGSFSFRYPVDIEGKPNFNWDEKVNVADIINMFYEVQPFLIFTENVLLEEGVIENEP